MEGSRPGFRNGTGASTASRAARWRWPASARTTASRSSSSASAWSTSGGHARDQRLQDALAGELAQRHGLQRRLHHVLGPAEQARHARPVPRWRRLRAVASAKATGQVGEGASAARCARRRRRRRPGCAATRPASGPSARSAGAARASRGCGATKSLSAVTRARSWRAHASCACASTGRSARAGRQRHLVRQPRRGARPRRVTQAVVDRGLQRLGVAEAADRQRRRGQPHQLQQRVAAAAHQWPCSWP